MEYGIMINRDPKRGLSSKFIKAVNMAINRKAFQDSQYLGDGDIVGSIFGTPSKETAKSICKGCDPAIIAPPPYDPAKALLQEDKWDFNRTLIVAGTADWLAMLKENLEAIGLKVELRTGAELTQDLMNKGEYDITDQGSGFIVNDLWNCTYWVGDPDVEIWLKWTKWVNEPFREAARIAIGTNDPAVLQPALKKCAEIYDQDGPIWGIGQIMSYFAVNKDIGGFVPETAFNFVGTCGQRGIESWYWKQ
jgi:ABC-type transport system substrate-binding protein